MYVWWLLRGPRITFPTKCYIRKAVYLKATDFHRDYANLSARWVLNMYMYEMLSYV